MKQMRNAYIFIKISKLKKPPGSEKSIIISKRIFYVKLYENIHCIQIVHVGIKL